MHGRHLAKHNVALPRALECPRCHTTLPGHFRQHRDLVYARDDGALAMASDDGVTCINCGAVYASVDHLAIEEETIYEGSIEQHPRESEVQLEGQAGMEKAFKNTYDRTAHLLERISAACLREPEIPEEDMALIAHKYTEFCDRAISIQRGNKRFKCDGTFWRQRRDKGQLHKRDIQALLRVNDSVRRVVRCGCILSEIECSVFFAVREVCAHSFLSALLCLP